MTGSSTPAVSVCIPTRNRARELGELLDQLAGQTWQDLEIVVVDDGSSDTTRDVVLAAAEANPKVRYAGLAEPAGVPGVVNAAVAAARADLVAFFHDHDRYAPEAVQRLTEALLASDEASFSFCGIVATDPVSGEPIGEYVEAPGFGRRYDVVDRFVRSGACAVAGCAVMVRRSRLPDPPFPPALGAFADVGLWCSLSAAGPTPCVPEALATVQGWTPQDTVGKLNWSVIGQLAALRRRYVPVVRRTRVARLREHARIAWQTARLRALFLFGVARQGWRAQPIPERAASDAPYAVAAFVGAMQAVGRHRV